MVLDTGTLAEVSVEVSADLSKLEAGFAKAREQAVKHNNDMKRLTSDQWTKIHLDRLNRAMTDQQRQAVAMIPVYQKNAQASRERAEALRRSTQRSMEEIAASRRSIAQLQAETAARVRNAAVIRRGGTGGGGGGGGGGGRDAERNITALGRAAGSATLLMNGFIAAVGVGLATQLGAAVTNTLKATAAIGDLAKAAGLTTTQFQEWRGVAMQLGIETKTMDQGMAEFADNVRQAAAGMDREEKVFKKLGVSLKDADGNARSMNDVLLDTIDRLGKVHNPLQRGAALALLFGETVGPQMAKLIDAGRSEIDNLREAVHELGLVMSEQEIQKADETARKLEQVSTVLSHEFASTVVANADSILKLAQALATVTSAVIGFLGSNPGLAVTLLGALAGGVITRHPLGAVAGGAIAYGTYRANQQEHETVSQQEWFRHMFIKEGKELRELRKAKGDTDPEVLAKAARVKRIRGRFVAEGGIVPGFNDGSQAAAGGGIDLSGLFDRDKKGRAGPKGPKPKDNIFEREEAQQAQERLRLLRSATVDLKRRNEIDHELVDYKLKERIAQINLQVSQGRLTRAQGDKLILEEQAMALMEKEAADREMRVDLIEQSTNRAQELLDAEAGILHAAAQMARTDKERNQIESAILRNKQQQELMEIDKSIAIARELGDQQKIADLTELRRKALERQGLETKGLAKSQLTGFEKFRDELPRTVDEINQQIDRIRFDKFMERLQEAARMAEEIGDAFGRAAGNLVRDIRHPLDALKGLAMDLGEIITQNLERQVSQWATQAIGGPVAKGIFGGDLMNQGGLNTEQMNMALDIATGNLNELAAAAAAASISMGGDGAAGAAGELNASAGQAGAGLAALDPQLAQFGTGLMSILQRFMGGGTGGGLAGLLKFGMSAIGSAFGGGGAADTGGGAHPWVDPSVGHWTPGSLGAGSGYAGGGWIRGRGTGRSDSNQIWVSDGEHITNADAANRFAPVLDGINSGMIPDIPSLGRLFQGRQKEAVSRGLDRIDARTIGGRLLAGMTQNYYIQTKDADSFRRSERQIRQIGKRRLGA